MIMHPNLSLVITQGRQRVALIPGYVIYQAAIFSRVPALRRAPCPLFPPPRGQTSTGILWEKGGQGREGDPLEGLTETGAAAERAQKS